MSDRVDLYYEYDVVVDGVIHTLTDHTRLLLINVNEWHRMNPGYRVIGGNGV